MSMKLSRAGYAALIEQDVAVLNEMPRTLERDHAIDVLRASIEHEYPAPLLPVAEEEIERLADLAASTYSQSVCKVLDLPAGVTHPPIRSHWAEVVRAVLRAAQHEEGKK